MNLKENKLIKNIIEIVVITTITMLTVFLFRTYIGTGIIVQGQSMEPNYHEGEYYIAQKNTFNNLKRFDVVIFNIAGKNEEPYYLIKRVIGLPGETVRIDMDGNIYINDKPIKEDYGLEQIKDPGIAKDGIKLSNDEIFCMGDNRNNSMDSRDPRIGRVNINQFVGKVSFQVTPIKKFGIVKD